MLLNQLIESRLLNKRKTAYCISGVLQYCDGILQNRFVVHLQSFFLNTPKFLIKSHLLAGSSVPFYRYIPTWAFIVLPIRCVCWNENSKRNIFKTISPAPGEIPSMRTTSGTLTTTP